MAKFEIKGLEKLIKDLEALPESIAKKGAREALDRALQPLAYMIAQRMPRDTGETAEAIHTFYGRKSGTVNITAGDRSHIAGWNEYGSRHNKANPVMRSTTDEMANGVLDDAIELLGEFVLNELKGDN